jgi:hypothetical protein
MHLLIDGPNAVSMSCRVSALLWSPMSCRPCTVVVRYVLQTCIVVVPYVLQGECTVLLPYILQSSISFGPLLMSGEAPVPPPLAQPEEKQSSILCLYSVLLIKHVACHVGWKWLPWVKVVGEAIDHNVMWWRERRCQFLKFLTVSIQSSTQNVSADDSVMPQRWDKSSSTAPNPDVAFSSTHYLAQ